MFFGRRFGSFVFGALGLVACESGTEIAGIDSATATREPDGRVTVTATMACEVVYGSGSMNNSCDADDQEACVIAEWYDASDTDFANAHTQSKACRTLGKVLGATITVRSFAPISTDQAMKIRVYPSPGLDAHDSRPKILTIDSPP